MKSPLAVILALALFAGLSSSGAPAAEQKKSPNPARAAAATPHAAKPAAKGKPGSNPKTNSADSKSAKAGDPKSSSPNSPSPNSPSPNSPGPKSPNPKGDDPKTAATESKSAAAAGKPTPAPAADAAKAALGAAAVGGVAAAATAVAQPQAPLTREEAVKRAEASLNSSPVMTADFVQIGGDGRRAEGKLYVHKVGRMRFEYAQPATMEVVSDGSQVAVRDRKLNTQDLYFINQTPLKFLLNEKIDLEKDVKLLDVVIDDAGASISIEDKATFGGTSKIKLIFDPKTFALKQWQVSDPQGYETLVSLFNIDRDSAPDPKLFKIEKGALLDFH